ncbi:hypothetical protein CRQ32_21265 [Salmonella enterica]|nr:hypothetical protein [Salmonella enterica]EKE2606115.1 hypothetical protein [Salmonella enterica]MIP16277.1 hypothetical protein [Salmonella enterica]HCB4364209.1 hypothetical protein [Salmonella enterica]
MSGSYISVKSIPFLLILTICSCAQYDAKKDNCQYINGTCYTHDYNAITNGEGVDMTTPMTKPYQPDTLHAIKPNNPEHKEKKLF